MFTYAEYNALPSVDIADEQANTLPHLRTTLLNVILDHNVQNIFGIRLIHKHFSMKEDEIAVFRPVTVPGISDVIIMGPLPSIDISRFSPQNYAVKDGQLVPYEYTTRRGPTLVDYPEFAAAFAKEVVAANATRIFGISTLDGHHSGTYELEIPELRYTVMIPSGFIPPPEDDMKDILTCWMARADQLLELQASGGGGGGGPGPPGVCRKTPTEHHRRHVTCPSDGQSLEVQASGEGGGGGGPGPPGVCRKTPTGHHRRHATYSSDLPLELQASGGGGGGPGPPGVCRKTPTGHHRRAEGDVVEDRPSVNTRFDQVDRIIDHVCSVVTVH